MKFSYNWLNDYFGGKLPPATELAEKIGLYSFELEGVEKLPNGDFLIDWDVLPNRSSDCLCYDGMVKEISAVLDLPAKDVLYRTEGVGFDSSFKTSDLIKLKIKDKQKVLRATKRMATDVKVGPSPDWLVGRLGAMGQKSINNVVDITNYVMWVTGQPVHAFDYDKLAGREPKKVLIKNAKKGEKIVDLTEEEHQLDDSILVIADSEKYLDLAGVKGGNVSGIDENTTRVLMSAVNFEYENIRNTSRKLKLQTDASKRYENEVPLYKVERAQKLFGYLLQELAGARVADEIIDTQPKIPGRPEIKVDLKKINYLLGTNISISEIENIFKRLGFTFQIEKEVFLVQPTADRLDLNISEDLIEEIGRIYGYANIAETFPEEGFVIPQENKIKKTRNVIGDMLTSVGFFEVYNRTIVQKGEVELANSLNARATCLRKNLLERLQNRVEKNFTHVTEPKIFEIGKIFTGIGGQKIDEYYSFAGIIGKRKIKDKQKAGVFSETKGVLEKVFKILGVVGVVWEENDGDDFIANLVIEKETVGSVGVNFWEINLEKLVKSMDAEINYKKPSKYPKIERDVAFWTPLDFTVAEAKEIIKNTLPTEAVELKLFDIYEDSENNKKSLAFNITFQSHEKTLSDKFANQEMQKIYNELEKNKFKIR